MSSNYRNNIINKVATSKHPVKNNLPMQAHHLISKHSVDLAKMKKFLKERGYDINVAENVALFPSTYQGACHLEMQLHRSNHIDAGPEYDDGDDNDNAHPSDYHNVVKDKYLKNIRDNMDDYCNEKTDRKWLQQDMDKVSKTIYGRISTNKLLLVDRNISNSFSSDSLAGCRNQTKKSEYLKAIDRGEECKVRSGKEKSHFPNISKSGHRYY